jgi:hypothetical protein
MSAGEKASLFLSHWKFSGDCDLLQKRLEIVFQLLLCPRRCYISELVYHVGVMCPQESLA